MRRVFASLKFQLALVLTVISVMLFLTNQEHVEAGAYWGPIIVFGLLQQVIQ